MPESHPIRWTELDPSQFPSTSTKHVVCLCDLQKGGCGRVVEVNVKNLRMAHRNPTGGSRQCVECAIKHGRTRSGDSRGPTYDAWHRMIQRCKPNAPRHKDYYDKGIRVCPEWLGRGGYEKFKAEIGPIPEGEGWALDRISNYKGYGPGNVRWVTRSQSQRHRRDRKLFEYNGEMKTLSEWAELHKCTLKQLATRIERNWTMHAALSYAAGGVPMGPAMGDARFGVVTWCWDECQDDKFTTTGAEAISTRRLPDDNQESFGEGDQP